MKFPVVKSSNLVSVMHEVCQKNFRKMSGCQDGEETEGITYAKMQKPKINIIVRFGQF